MNFEYSAKNIPLADERTYMEMMIHAIEKFGKNITWRAFFKLNPQIVSKTKETYGFGSLRAPPRLKELKEFEKDLVKLMQNIRFRKRSNSFLGSLKREIRKISDQKNLIIPADKTTNNYLVPTDKYRNLINKEIHKKIQKGGCKECWKSQLGTHAYRSRIGTG